MTLATDECSARRLNRFRRFLVRPRWDGVRELLVDRADQLNRNYVELIREKTLLTCRRIYCFQEIGHS